VHADVCAFGDVTQCIKINLPGLALVARLGRNAMTSSLPMVSALQQSCPFPIEQNKF
jgi:hypothetical protein